MVGTICNTVPIYDNADPQADGSYLWDASTLTITKTDLNGKTAFVVLKCEPYKQDEFSGGSFPDIITAQVVFTVQEYEDKDDAGFLVLAIVRGRTSTTDGVVSSAGVEVFQLVTGSKWAERRKFSDSPATYIFYNL